MQVNTGQFNKNTAYSATLITKLRREPFLVVSGHLSLFTVMLLVLIWLCVLINSIDFAGEIFVLRNQAIT